MPLTATRGLVRATERWFVHRGVPTLIANYSFRRHVLPRMLPFLALVAVASLSWLTPTDAGAGRAWLLLGGVIVVGVTASALLTALGRRLPQVPRPWVRAILIGYAAMPVVVPVLGGLLYDRPVTGTVATLLAAFAVLFAASWASTAYGLVPLTRRALRQAIGDMGNSLQLQGRALPLLLFATLFFFTGELWQAMNRLSWWRLAGALALFAAVTVLAAAGRLREEIGRVEQDLRPSRLTAACVDTPLSTVPTEQLTGEGPLHPPALTARQIGNLLVMLATRQLMRSTVVGAGLFVFLMLLGLLIVTDETAEQWIGVPTDYAELLGTVPVALLRNGLLLAGFGSMYFAVTSMTDTEHRQRFFAPILDEVERMLAVRAVYLGVRDVVFPNPPSATGPSATASSATASGSPPTGPSGAGLPPAGPSNAGPSNAGPPPAGPAKAVVTPDAGTVGSPAAGARPDGRVAPPEPTGQGS